MSSGLRLAVASIVFLFVLMMVPVSGSRFEAHYPTLYGVVENSAHPLIFMIVGYFALTGFRSARLRRPYVWTWLVAIALGASTELAQLLVGRDASFTDLFHDGIGASAALLYAALSDTQLRAGAHRRGALLGGLLICGLMAVLPLAAAGAAYAQRAMRMPVLWIDHNPLDRFFVAWRTGQYPGFGLREPYPDWRGYRFLVLTVEHPGTGSQPVVLRVHDVTHNNQPADRYNEAFVLPPRLRQDIRVPLERIETAPADRRMDMRHIRSVILFQNESYVPAKFRITEMRLER